MAVALKAWYVDFESFDIPYDLMLHLRQRRKALKQYVVSGTAASRTGKMFALLVESGVIYCAIWVSLTTPEKVDMDNN